MKPILKSLLISTVIVVGYPFVVLGVAGPLAFLWGAPYSNSVSNSLLMPLGLPTFIMHSLYPSAHLFGRMPIELSILLLGWFIAFNVVIYCIPIRMLVEWRERKSRLP